MFGVGLQCPEYTKPSNVRWSGLSRIANQWDDPASGAPSPKAATLRDFPFMAINKYWVE
ncbi:hypothetical protein O5D80_005761 [Batrachochytrium dendrobatidis]|nr:hypothetical protein O5D80_005761 [Batrachochytrium dendrobatidis]